MAKGFIAMSKDTWHVCSLVVQSSAELLAAVSQSITDIPEAEVVTVSEDGCKLVVVMQSDDADLLYQKIESIQYIDGVLAVSLVYHQQDESIEVSR